MLLISFINLSDGRHKEESSSSDEDHRASNQGSNSIQSEHGLVPGGVSYKKTLRLTSEQLVRSLFSKRCHFEVVNPRRFTPSYINSHSLSLSRTAVAAAAGRSQRCCVQRDHSVPGNLPLSGHHLPLELGRQDHYLGHRWHHHQVYHTCEYVLVHLP